MKESQGVIFEEPVDSILDLGFFRGVAVMLQAVTLYNPILAVALLAKMKENERWKNGRAMAKKYELEGLIPNGEFDA